MYGGPKGTERVAAMRKQQIDTLRIFNDRVTEVTEGSEYKVEFYSNGKLFVVVVLLGNEFPLEKPVLRVEPSVSHTWVNGASGEIISAPGLLKFTIHSELGRVVQAIVREFELRPPPLAEGFQKDYRISDNSNDLPLTVSVGSSNGDSTIISNLSSLTIQQLARLHSEPLHLEEFITNLPVMSELSKTLEDEISKIESNTLENLERQEELTSLKTTVNHLTLQLSGIFEEYQSLSSEYSKLCEKFHPHSIRESLVSSISKIDEESEKIAEKFLSGDIDLDRFLSDYSSHRYLSHSRKFKAESLGTQLNKLHQAGF